IIERGAPRVRDVDHREAVARMIENTDDAYGFPPFRYLAPSIAIGGEGYRQLRERERAILDAFLSGIRVRSLASDNFGWADEIPPLLGGGLTRPAADGHAFPSWDGLLAVSRSAA